MLKKFSVKNYKNFQERIELDFSDTKVYRFNQNAIKNNLIRTGIIYGKVGVGKSNLGFALFDIILHLTDNEKSTSQISNYLNGDSEEDTAQFIYEFEFENYHIKYEYQKKSGNELVSEYLEINDKKIFSFNFLNGKGDFDGLKFIDVNSLLIDINFNISVIRYIYYNSNIDKTNPISMLMEFVNAMLLYREVPGKREYLGFKKGREDIIEYLVINNKVQDFQDFLKKFDINFNLTATKDPLGKSMLLANYKYRVYEFISVASSGTSVLLLYYYWLTKVKQVKFLFIDEFGANLHIDASRSFLKILADELDLQVLLTTHNTYLMTNKILRPDCYYILVEGKVKPLFRMTEKELRVGHNLEKLFRDGVFEEES